MTAPFYTLQDIRNKVRRITGRPNTSQITDAQIDQYINTFYVFDLSEQLRLESFRVNYQFLTNANQPVYDFPKEYYLTTMPPVYIGGYQTAMTQSRETFFRFNSQMTSLQQRVATGTGVTGPYTFTTTARPICPGWKRNPPGAYTPSIVATGTDVPANTMSYNVLISALDANGVSVSLIDDGGPGANGHTTIGNLFDVNDASTVAASARGTINYITGQVNINAAPSGFARAIPVGNQINCQYIPYVANRPRSACFYQDQILLYPIPDQAYVVSFEAFVYPTAFLDVGAPPVPPATTSQVPQLRELWQLLAYGAADKIFSDNGDIENMTKFRPLLEEQMKLAQRRTIVQYTSDRVATIYSDMGGNQFPWGNQFGGF